MPAVAEQRRQPVGVAAHVVAGDVDLVAVEQAEQRLPRGVERERPGVADPQTAAEPLGRRGEQAGAGGWPAASRPLRWVTTTPLGRPVEPEVKMT